MILVSLQTRLLGASVSFLHALVTVSCIKNDRNDNCAQNFVYRECTRYQLILYEEKNQLDFCLQFSVGKTVVKTSRSSKSSLLSDFVFTFDE